MPRRPLLLLVLVASAVRAEAKPPPCRRGTLRARPLAKADIGQPTYSDAFGSRLLLIRWDHTGKQPIVGRIYDAARDRWFDVAPGLADIDEARADLGGNLVLRRAGDRYVVASWRDSRRRQNQLRVLDVVANRWHAPDLAAIGAGGPDPVFALTGQSVVYVTALNGPPNKAAASDFQSTHIWDLRKQTWRPVAALARGSVELHQAAVVNDRLFVLIAEPTSSELPSRWKAAVYDPARSRWIDVAVDNEFFSPYLFADHRTRMVTALGRTTEQQLVGAGSMTAGGTYDVRTGSWRPLPEIDRPLSAADEALADGTVVAARRHFLAPGARAWVLAPEWPNASASLLWAGGRLEPMDNRDGHGPALAVFDLSRARWCTARLPRRVGLNKLDGYTVAFAVGRRLILWGRRETELAIQSDDRGHVISTVRRLRKFHDEGYVLSW